MTAADQSTVPMLSTRDFVRVRASLDPAQESAYWWTGNIYSNVPGERGRHLFRFEGVNMARAVETEDGYQLLTREAAVYQDAATGAIVDYWDNPFNGREVEVVHVWNDPFNQLLADSGPRALQAPVLELGQDWLCVYADVWLAYPSPLSRAEFPLHSQSDLYQGGELFQFFVQPADLELDTDSVPCVNSWTRIGPWLPWMEMADQPGNVVYQCAGRKLPGGYADVPAHLREHIERNDPKYASAPTEFAAPNESSWTYMKRLLESKQG